MVVGHLSFAYFSTLGKLNDEGLCSIYLLHWSILLHVPLTWLMNVIVELVMWSLC